MRKMDDDIASIVPLAIVFLLIIVGGLLIGILGLVMSTVSNSDNNINSIFTLFWSFIAVIVLIVISFWAIVKAQREG